MSGLRYYDFEMARRRFKRRYVWACWAGLLGLAIGLLIGAAF